MRRAAAILGSLVFASACQSQVVPAGPEGDVCRPRVEQTLDPDQMAAIGFSARDVHAVVGGVHTLAFRYTGGDETSLLLDVEAPTGARFIDLEPASAFSLNVCEDRVEFDTSVGFTTADGAFAERFDLVVDATDADEARFRVDLDVDALAGSYMLEGLDPSTYSAIDVTLEGRFAAGWRGELEAAVVKVDDENGDVDTVPLATYE